MTARFRLASRECCWSGPGLSCRTAARSFWSGSPVSAGYAGLEDQVDNHWGELFKAAALSTFLAVGTELGAGSDTNSNDSAIIQALRHGASDSLNQNGQQVVRRSL